jgi:hypothetical protein
MPLNLCDYEVKAHEAIKRFWQSRVDATHKQQALGRTDQGERTGVTGGKNLDGFAELIIDLCNANGLPHAQIHQ